MIYFDEAGNTGDNLLDANQPTFTLASHDFSYEETMELLGPLFSIVNSNELHFKALAKRPKYQSEIIKLLNNESLSNNRVFRFAVDKKFCVIVHIVDRLIEYVMNENGIDLYQEGQNLTMANMMYILYKSVWKEDFDQICLLFVVWVRQKTKSNSDDFYTAVFKLLKKVKETNIVGEEFIGFISMSNKFKNQIQAGFDSTYTMDPTLSTFRTSCNFWAQKHDMPEIVLDASKPISHFLPVINMLKGANEQTVGYGKRSYEFKLKVGDVKLVNSLEIPQIQFADIIASSFNLCARALVRSELIGFAKDIYESSSFELASGDAIWPTTNVTPESIGMKDANEGVNPLDHFAREATNMNFDF